MFGSVAFTLSLLAAHPLAAAFRHEINHRRKRSNCDFFCLYNFKLHYPVAHIRPSGSIKPPPNLSSPIYFSLAY